MSNPRSPAPVKLIASLFSADELLISEAIEKMSDIWGRTDFISETMKFDHTDYYRKEFGAGLKRRFAAFETLIDPVLLPEIKISTNRLEAELGTENRRYVNIDPGYITAERLVLATGKNYSHRIYLDYGIYADLTLIYQKGGFKSLPWTFPDYASDEIKELLGRIRDKYLFQLTFEKPGACRI